MSEVLGMKIAITANEKGVVLKEKVKVFLTKRHYEMYGFFQDNKF
jgi:ribose 5-phosphate isomerase RpiB